MESIFLQYKLNNDARVFLLPTKKFKTVAIDFVMHQDLTAVNSTKTALFPSVLLRGSKSYPSTLELTKRLEELYGLEISSDILKRGERQIVQFTMEMPDDQYISEEDSLLEKGLNILYDVIFNPLIEGDGFKGTYLEQEKDQLARHIKGMINDKASYSVERCVQEMCSEERYGVFKYGNLADLENITAKDLLVFYQEAVSKLPVDIFILGDINPEKTVKMLNKIFVNKKEKELEIAPTEVTKPVTEIKYKEEKMNISQGKLTMGYRTNTTYADKDIFSLIFYNGILGGFPHSKLFQNVREKASLAYYAYSRLEKTKGIMIISSGIEFKDYEKALNIINEQLDHIKEGNISELEMENTRVGLINAVKAQADNPYALISNYLEGVVNKRHYTTEEIIDLLRNITRDDVVRVAKKIELDTVYFLRN